MIRVLQIIRKMSYGGAETLIMNIFRTIDRTKVQFDFLVSEKGEYDDEIKKLGGKIFFIPTRRQGIFKYRKACESFFENNSKYYNAIHYHCSSLSDIFPLKMAKKYAIKNRIVHSHNTFQKGIIHNILNIVNKLNIDVYATKKLACSTEAGKYVFGNRTFEVIQNGIQAKKFIFDEAIRDKKRFELGIKENEITILNVGRLTEQKNQIFLIEIFKRILNFNHNAKLLIVGQGELEDEIKSKIKELNVSDKVLLLKQRDDVNEIMQAADVFLLPSLYEGLPLVGIEAQAAGLPIIVSNKVSQELKITNLVKFISLNQNVNDWALEVINASKLKRKNMYETIKNKGYDIISTTEKLQKYYIS